MNNFTLIIPTHNRHKYLKRSIDYFKHLDAKILYCDSSMIAYNNELHSNMQYLHLPKKNFAEKILLALDKINTKFVALCADDDFILIKSLYEGYEILSKQTNFKTLLGINIFFHENFNGKFYSTNKPLPKDINFSPYENGPMFLSNYNQALWGLYDKEIISKSFELINKAKFLNDNFIELTIGAIAGYCGGIKYLNNIWSVRELSANEHWGDRHKAINNIYTDKLIRIDFKKYKQLLDLNTFKGYADLILKHYLGISLIQKYKLITKGYIKELIPNSLLKKIKNSSKESTYVDSFDKYSILNKVLDFTNSSEIKNILENNEQAS